MNKSNNKILKKLEFSFIHKTAAQLVQNKERTKLFDQVIQFYEQGNLSKANLRIVRRWFEQE